MAKCLGFGIGLVVFGALAITGCPKQDETAGNSSTTSSTAGHDPDDFSVLRKYPLKSLVQSSVKVNGTEIPVYVMDDEPKRAEGFMYLRPQDAPDGHGMIFLFPKAEQQSFWMQNCRMELDIAFIGPDKKVLNVVRGKMLDESPLPSKGPSKYVLELKAGEAEKFGVKAGDKVDIPKDLEVNQ